MRPGSPLEELLRRLASRPRHSTRNAEVVLAAQLRGRDVCEYCLLPSTTRFEIDHIIPRSRWQRYQDGMIPGLPPLPTQRGPNHLDNYAWVCPDCNVAKGQQVTVQRGAQAERLFDPRRDVWMDHFVFAHSFLIIVGVSRIGRATEAALALNSGGLLGRLGARHDEILVGRYPPAWARDWIV